jgi:predicted MPP superfamily phosphohydrolase
MQPRVNDEEFIKIWKRLGSAALVAKELDLAIRNVHSRRKRIEERHGVTLNSNDKRSPTFLRREHAPRVDCEMENGVIIVGSDAHYWPGQISTAHKAFVQVIKDLKPELVVMNGDLFDGARISRYPQSAWIKLPTVKEELDAVSERLHEVKQAAGSGKTWWCLGNHDMRFDAKLANNASEFEGVPGFTLSDHFPGWNISISLFVNQSLMIKHRFRNGTHATWNNTLYSGVSMCTGHLHRLQATILNDYGGTRWGIDCGTLGETEGDHMHYGEDNPTNHCSGFAVLTIVNGQLLHPEFCVVIDEKAYFRGKEVVCD